VSCLVESFDILFPTLGSDVYASDHDVTVLNLDGYAVLFPNKLLTCIIPVVVKYKLLLYLAIFLPFVTKN